MIFADSTSGLHAFACWLHEWQDLAGGIIGAVVGGVMGFVGAYVVARSQQERENRNAARMLMLDLVSFESVYSALGRAYALEQVADDQYLKWYASKLQQYHYRTSPLFRAQLACVVGFDGELAGHLKGFLEQCLQIDEDLDFIDGADGADVFSIMRARNRLQHLPTKVERAHKRATDAIPILGKLTRGSVW